MKIFLSYGHDRNEELVIMIMADLERLGHDVWIDKKNIKCGDWREKITKGILDSDWMLSFLSKKSTNHRGVCLDELGIAINHNKAMIQTILVEGEEEVTVPNSISDIQWLDMRDWLKRKKENPAEFSVWYADKFAEIRRVLESETSQRFAGEIEVLKNALSPVFLDAFTTRLLEKGFVGRDWLEEDVENWLRVESSRAFILTGEPGIGKSAFAVRLAHFNKAKVLAAVFLRYDQAHSSDPRRVILTLAFQLASRLPDYRKLLIALVENQDYKKMSENELFDHLLSNPLRLCIRRDNGVVLIDALDESFPDGVGVAKILARHAQNLPTWLKIVATTRPEPKLLQILSELYPRVLAANDRRNQEDVALYLLKNLAGFNPSKKAIDAIVGRSDGNFLYAEKVVEMVHGQGLSFDRIDEFPHGLSGIYAQYFQRKYPDVDHYHANVSPALKVLLAAQEPLNRDELGECLGLSETATNRLLLGLGSLFPVAGGRVQSFHRSLAEWLTSSEKAGDYLVSLREGHSWLADIGWTKLKKLLEKDVVNPSLSYVLLFLGAHLYASSKNNVLEDMIFEIVKAMNRKNFIYGEILGKLIDYISTESDVSRENVFKNIIKNVAKNKNNFELIALLNSGATKLNRMGRSDLARFLHENIKIIMKRFKLKTVIELRTVINFHENAGVFYREIGEYNNAVESVKRAVFYGKELLKKDPLDMVSKIDVARSYNSLGIMIFEHINGGSDQAIESFQSALLILRDLDTEFPEHTEVQHLLSETYRYLGRLHQTQRNRSEERSMFNKSLAIRRSLVEKNPMRIEFQSELAHAIDIVGLIDKEENELGNALDLLKEALHIREYLVKADPNAVNRQFDLGVSHSNIAGVYCRKEDLFEAMKWLRSAIEIYSSLLKKDPSRVDFRRAFVLSQANAGRIYLKENNYVLAEHSLKKALEEYGALVLNNGASVEDLSSFALCHRQLAQVFFFNVNKGGAVEYNEKAIAIYEHILSKHQKRNDVRVELNCCYKNRKLMLELS